MNDRDLERFWQRVQMDPNSGCWLWTGSATESGYGMLSNGRKKRPSRSHRLSYEHFKEPIPKGTEVDHLCRNTYCCNPDHLEAVTHRENMQRSPILGRWARGVTHCSKGHEFTPDNCINSKHRPRKCRTCHNHRALIANKTPEQLERVREIKREYQRRVAAKKRATA